jgi:hypothetical protein
MKNYQKLIVSGILFLTIFFGGYFLLSLMGIVFGSTYKESAGCVGWFFVYSMFGIFISGFVANEAYEEL